MGSILESGRSPGGGHGNPLQDSCLENLMDRGAWGATVYRVSESGTTAVTWHMQMHTCKYICSFCNFFVCKYQSPITMLMHTSSPWGGRRKEDIFLLIL